MPAPTVPQLEAIASNALQSAGIRGQGAAGLARALADATAQALTLFIGQAQVLSGIPAVVSSESGSGATVGPGRLLPPPAGGPDAVQLEGLAQAALTAQHIQGEKASALAKVIAASLAQGIALFTAQMQVKSGITISSFVTTSPGNLH